MSLIFQKNRGTRTIQRLDNLKADAAQHFDVFTQCSLARCGSWFCPQRSIRSNAEPHVQSKIVINMDLQDFFPSMTYARTKGVLNWDIRRRLLLFWVLFVLMQKHCHLRKMVSNIICVVDRWCCLKELQPVPPFVILLADVWMHDWVVWRQNWALPIRDMQMTWLSPLRTVKHLSQLFSDWQSTL